MTNQEAGAATAATVKITEKQGLTCDDAVGRRVAVPPGDVARGGDDAVMLIGTSSGMLHCISCSSGQLLWQMHNSGSISTAAGISPASSARAPSEAPAAAGTDALADLSSDNLVATHEGVQTDAQTDAHTVAQTDAKMGCSVNHQRLSSPTQQPGAVTQMQMTFDHVLVSCTNNGGVRVLNLPAVACPVVWLDPELLESGQRAARPDEEVRQMPMPRTWAAAQMPGECVVC